jgi:beta-aspartyl-peptidase (threonine type)
MGRACVPLLVTLLTVACTAPEPSSSSSTMNQQSRWGIVIHGGAGNFTMAGLESRREPMRDAMTEALSAGHRVLARGGSSLDAVEAAIVVLEDSPLFNAGKGAVFTHAGTNELDASVMDGSTHRAGAVAGVKRIKNPILLARLVMEKSPHVMMTGDGAETFAAEQGGIEFVEPKYFYTDRAWDALQRASEEERQKLKTGASAQPAMERDAPAGYFGTVGAVALDQQGNLAAGTSTGGMTNKRFGRVGDSPIVGAGTYASNQSCGISATGHGEYFIRYTVAHDICARVAYKGIGVQAAADEVVQQLLKNAGGEGGVVGLDRTGNIAMSFNTSGMSRGYAGTDGKPVVMFTNEDAVQVQSAKD